MSRPSWDVFPEDREPVEVPRGQLREWSNQAAFLAHVLRSHAQLGTDTRELPQLIEVSEQIQAGLEPHAWPGRTKT